MPDRTGRFVWYELMTTNPSAAIEFYGKAVGWGKEAWGPGADAYTMLTNNGKAFGGVTKVSDEMKAMGIAAGWFGHVKVKNVDETAGLAASAGGKVIHAPMDIPGDVGRYAIIADPQGAVLNIFAPNGPDPVDDPMPAGGDVSWAELHTSDRKGAFDFYRKLFGWESIFESDMGTAGIYQIFGMAGRQMGGLYQPPDGNGGPARWSFYIQTEDIQSAAERVKNSGGTVLNGPMEVPGGSWIAQCKDPQGVSFALQRPGAA